MTPDERPSPIDLDQPRAVGDVIVAALGLLVRFPLLFVSLALIVVGPYELVVLATTKAAPFGQQNVSAATAFVLVLVDAALVGPLVSALHVQAVAQIGRGGRPGIAGVITSGLGALPVVVAAQIVAGIGIGLGLLAFVIPGVILAIRWAVVAQVAAIERTDWMGALRRSGELARRNYLHILGVIIVTTIVNYGLSLAGGALTGSSSHAPQVAIGIAVVTLTRCFSALATAVLYFDLGARSRTLKPQYG